MSSLRSPKRSYSLVVHLAIAALVLVGLRAAVNTLTSDAPDFDAACSEDRPYFVASSFRAQASRSKPPNMRAPSVVLFRDTPNDDPHYTLATFMQTGAVWGLAYRHAEPAVYAATYHKRALPYGPEGPGAIYRIDLATGEVTHFATVPNAGSQRRGSSMSNGTRAFDSARAREVGKTSLGDLELSTDESMLFVVNLHDRRIYRFAMPSGDLIDSFDHGAVGERWARDARPFGLAFHDGHLYHGVLNSRGAGSAFVAHVYRCAPDGSGMTLVADIGLHYAREGIRLRTVSGRSLGWRPWQDRPARPPRPGERQDRFTLHGPQPMLTDLEFTASGDMVVGLRDRHWDIEVQWIREHEVLGPTEVSAHRPTPTAPPPERVMSEPGLGFGDILRGQVDGDGWLIETDPEHFDDTNALGHAECALGALASVPGTDTIVATAYGVKDARSETIVGEEGVYWFDVESGNRLSSESLGRAGRCKPYDQLLRDGGVASAHCKTDVYVQFEYYRDLGSLGDVEALCRLRLETPTPTLTPTPVYPPPTETNTPPPRVTTPTPTETQPPPTDTPSPTPSPTSTRVPGPIYLPLMLKEHCDPKRMHADVALVIDASLTMTEHTRAGRTKIEAAKEAAGLFMDAMAFPDDQVAIVSFNADAYVLHSLSGDGDSARAALDAIENQEFTRIDLGIERAREQLTGPSHDVHNVRAIILLTDGRSNPVPVSQALDAAEAARREGITLYTVGLGDECETEALREMASRPECFHYAPDGEDLSAIYAELAAWIPCSPDQFWGRRSSP